MRNTLHRILKSEFLKNLFTLVSATSVAQGIALLIYPILSRIYTPSEHGLFALYMSIISVTAIISTGKYELAVMLPRKNKHSLSLVYLSLIISVGFSVFLMIIISLFHERIPIWLGNPDLKSWLFFIPLSTLMIGVFQTFNYWNNRHKFYKSISAANLGQSLVNSTVKLTTSSAISSGGGLIAGAITGQFAGVIIYLRTFFKKGKQKLDIPARSDIKEVAKKYSFFPRYNMLHYLTNNFSSSLPVFVFSSWFSSVEVGFYSLGFMMINRPMNLVTNSLTQVFSQRIIEKFNRGEVIRREVKYLVTRLILMTLVPFTLAGIFGPEIFSFVFGDEWVESGKYMRILLPWLFIVFISSPLSFLPDVLSRQKKAMWIDLIKFFLRIIALAIGVIMNDIYLALLLFSGISFILVSYNLFWYVNLSAVADKKSQNTA